MGIGDWFRSIINPPQKQPANTPAPTQNSSPKVTVIEQPAQRLPPVRSIDVRPNPSAPAGSFARSGGGVTIVGGGAWTGSASERVQQATTTGIPPTPTGASGVVSADTKIPSVVASAKPTFAERVYGAVGTGATELGQSVSYYISLGGALEYKPLTSTSAFAPTIPIASRDMGGKGTLTFTQPTYSQLTPEQKLEFTTTQSSLSKSLGGISEEQFTQQQAQAEKQYVKDVTKADIPLSFARGAVFGAVSALAVPVGLTLGGVALASTVFNYPKIKEQYSIAPTETTLNIGAGFAGGIIGGATTGYGISKYENYMFQRELAKTKFELIGYQKQISPDTTYIGYATTKNVDVRGTQIAIKSEQIIKDIGGEISRGNIKTTVKLIGDTRTTTNVYEGVPTVSQAKGTYNLISPSNKLSFNAQQAILGKTNMQLVSSTIKTNYPDIFTGRIYEVTKTYNAPFQKQYFGGVISQKEGYYDIIAGKATSGRLYLTGERTITTGANIKARIFTGTTESAGETILGTGSKTFIKTVPSTIQSSVSQVGAVSNIISQTKGISSVSIAPALTSVIPSIAQQTRTVLGTSQIMKQQTKTSYRVDKALIQTQVTKSIQTSIPKSSFGFGTGFSQITSQVQTPRLDQQLIQTPKQTTTQTGVPAFSFLTPPPTIFGFFPSLPTGLDFTTRTRKLPKGKRRSKYTPSFEALILGIKGKAPKKLTGIEIRPIPRGFKWEYGRTKIGKLKI